MTSHLDRPDEDSTEVGSRRWHRAVVGSAEFEAVARIGTLGGADYDRNRGIMRFVLRNLRRG